MILNIVRLCCMGGEQVPPWTIGAQVRLLFPHTTQQSGLGGILMDIIAGNVYSNCSMSIKRPRSQDHTVHGKAGEEPGNEANYQKRQSIESRASLQRLSNVNMTTGFCSSVIL